MVALTATTIALAVWAYAARRIARILQGPQRLGAFAPGAVAFGIAISGLIVPTALAGRLVGSFDAGLVTSAALGIAAVLGARRFGPAEPMNEAPISRNLSMRVYLATTAIVVLYGVLCFTYQMHDERALFGHKAIIEQLRYDEYPPQYPPIPGEDGRYHYGFDILAGALARGYGLSSDWAIDIVSLVLVVFMSLAAAAAAVDAGARRSAPFSAVAIHLGAGLAFLVLTGVDGRHPRCLVQYHHPTCGVELFPTQLLNVFQHPVAVGVPLFLVMVLLLPRLGGADDRLPGLESSSGRWLVGGATAVVAACALGQFVYFALGSLAACAWFVFWHAIQRRGRRTASRAAGLGVALGAGLVLAYLMGGMLAASPSIDPDLVVLRPRPGFPADEDVVGILWHHLANLGLGFVLLPLFLWAAWVRRSAAVTMLVLFALGGILVPHLFDYVRSWDIVKFPSAASFALTTLYVVVVDAWLVTRRFPYGGVRRTGRFLLCGGGALAAIYLLFPLQGSLRLYDRGHWKGDPLVRQTIAWWRSRDYDRHQVIYAQSNVARELSIFGGLSVVAQDSDFYYVGIRHEILRRQKRWGAAVKQRMDPEALDALGIYWLMFSGEELKNLGPRARRALEDPKRFEEVATFPASSPDKVRKIWRRVLGKSSGQGCTTAASCF